MIYFMSIARCPPIRSGVWLRSLWQFKAASRPFPLGRGYGNAFHQDGPFAFTTWRQMIQGHLSRTAEWIGQAKVVDPAVIDPVSRLLPQFDSYFAGVLPTPFLDDITTKNVLLNGGRLSGIVDVDELCFGDPLFVVALTKMSLLAHRLPTDYIGFWIDLLQPSAEQMRALELYTAVHCVCFIAENGQRFNRGDTIVQIGEGRAVKRYL